MSQSTSNDQHDEKAQAFETTPTYGDNSTAVSTPTLALSEQCLSPRGSAPDIGGSNPRPPAPDHSANALSRLTFHWIGGVLRNGFKRPLRVEDVPLINPKRRVDHGLADNIQVLFDQYRERGDKFALWSALYATFKREFWIGGACRGVADILLVVTPYTLRFLIQFAIDSYNAGRRNEPTPPISHGIGLLVGIVSMLAIQTLCHNQFMFLLGVIGGQTRAVLVASVFDKSMRIRGRGSSGTEESEGCAEKIVSASSNEKKMAVKLDAPDYSLGQLTNLVSVDCTRIDRSTTAIHMLWTAPVSLMIAIALLIVNLRVSALAGLGLLLVGFGILITAVGILFQQRKGIDKVTEERVSSIQEVLGAAQLVKYLAWEDGFVRRIADIRGQEARKLHAFQAVRNVVGALSQSLPLVTAMVSFVTYAKINSGGLSPAVVFSSVALFTSLRMPMIYLPLCIQGCIDSWAALGRVQHYLSTKEPERHEYDPSLEFAADIQDATFVWNQKRTSVTAAPSDDGEVSIQLPIGELEDSSDFKLRNLNLQIRRGELIVIIGSVGSGKTAMLSALMGSMTKTSGSVVWGETYAICSQQAWVYNATVRENILLGKPFEKDRYYEVLRVCSMQRDLDLLAHGDSTVVGERGIVLSGGQKQRISLARALYSRAQALLLDDPLSAVDANVGQDILDLGICGDLAVGRTRILCTHDMRVLHRCDRVLWIKNGRIESLDTFERLMNSDPEFIALVQAKEQDSRPTGGDNDGLRDGEDSPQSTSITTANLEKKKSKAASKSESSEIDELMQEEDRAVQSVPWTVYGSLIKWSNSAILVSLCIPVLCLAQGSTVLASLWLAWWSQLRFSDLSLNQYIGIYAGLACSQAVFAYFFGFILSVCCTRSSQAMLHKAVLSLLHAPMSFFDTTPLGRHVNRFSTDVEVTDYNLTEALRMFMTSLSGLAAIFVVIIVYFNWFAIAAGALLAVLAFLAFYYRATAREVKRFESVFRSAVFVRFIEGVKGASTIRTYGQDVAFGRNLRCALDDVNSATFTTHAVQRWLGLRQDIAATALVAVMGVLVLVDRFKQHPSIAGLVLSLMLNAVQVTQVVVREWAEVEGAMNAVERLYEYAINIPKEEPGADLSPIREKDADKAGPGSVHEFLKAGEIKFDNVRLRYRPGLPESLQGVNLHVRAGEHVAIVGRTGAGKSSMVNALFRMIEVSGGSIFIDGTDISGLRLKDLRGALSIIPQEATLFSGTIRSNLDPFEAVSDTYLWAALRAAASINRTISLSDVVTQDGANLSQGQRQLLALARALVRNGYKDESDTGRENCILVCDEATAALDGETDDQIQGVLRTAFHKKTIISIAHRLRTVLWYDRVYVMDAGQVAESGSPLELFMNQEGIFRQLCVKQGITEEQVMESATEESLRVTRTKGTQNSLAR